MVGNDGVYVKVNLYHDQKYKRNHFEYFQYAAFDVLLKIGESFNL